MTMSNENRVWVKASALEAVRNPRKSWARRPSARTDSGRSFLDNSMKSLSMDGDSDSTSVRSCSVVQQQCRGGEWGWKLGNLLETTAGYIVIQMEDYCDDGSLAESAPADNVYRLPASAMNDGEVVMSNDFPLDEHGNTVAPHDLISLTHLHEPAVVESLTHRYELDQIYTYTGPVLLALNPFKNVRGLYGEANMKRYWDHAEKSNARESLPPHIYSIADSSFRNMMRKLDEDLDEDVPSGCNQSILVSGESGAGKTVTAKFVMKYLAALSQRAGVVHNTPQKRAYAIVAEKRELMKSPVAATGMFSTPTKRANSRPEIEGLDTAVILNGSSSNSIEAQVLQSNPILESFGNARTVRNDNSSRFGKFIEMQFTRYGKLVGAQIETYLLEKVRLVTQGAGERNYHIFFELLSGSMDALELRQFFLAPTATPDDFKMTCSGTYDRRDGVDDKHTYRELRLAMQTMRFAPEEQRDIFSVTAAILHASNLNFLDLGAEESSLDERNVHLAPVCHLLGVTAGDLNRALCYFSITAGKDVTVERALNVEKAEKGLEALLKATYGALFSYLVQRINDSISHSNGGITDDPVASIGVLDIFGFESFKVNSFEQLCINYCNEALQQQFNAFVLENEQAEYEREGIEWSFIEFPDNQDVLDLIEKRGSGILSILDDQCRAPGTSDRAFASAIYNKCKGNARFGASRKQTAMFNFSVFHYAGPVDYSTHGFTEKNRDELPKETSELLINSMNPFIRLLAKIIEDGSSAPPPDTTGAQFKLRRQVSSSVSRITVGGQFRRQLMDLRKKINVTSPHYIRCLKPNDVLVPDHFDTNIVAEQLKCGGILEAVRVARAGFTQHYPHEDFIRRYRSLSWKEMNERKDSIPPKINIITGNALPPSGARRASYRTTTLALHQQAEAVALKASSSTAYNTNPEIKGNCKVLISLLLKRLQTFERTDFVEEVDTALVPEREDISYNKSVVGTPTPSWRSSGKNRLPPVPATAPAKTRGGKARSGRVESLENMKKGIQMGKTKVFLRHKMFEMLERLRSRVHTLAATKLNSIFRRYLARLAYLPVRAAFRHEINDRLNLWEDDDFKETKEDYPEGYDTHTKRFLSSHSFFNVSGEYNLSSWDSQVRQAIHNPVPRSEWGKQGLERQNFKWVLKDGIWVKNLLDLEGQKDNAAIASY